MSRIPILGAQQIDARLDGSPPRVRTRSRMCWRAHDGILLPLNEGLSVEYVGRSTTATIYDSRGTSGALVASAPAFSSIDWDRDGVREEDALVLSDEEALRFFDPSTEQLMWDTAAEVWRLDWIERGTAMDDGAPYASLSNDAATGPYFGLFGDGAGNVELVHYNGTDTVTSSRPVADGDCCSARAIRFASGAVQLGLVKNGAAESLGTKSGALAPEAWGGGSGVQLRLNEFGDDVRGVMDLRYFAAYGGFLTRQQLLEVL